MTGRSGIQINPKTGKIVGKRFPLSEIMEASDDMAGFCVACGNRQDGCEPDARKYLCEDCGNRTVYGAEELAVMGLVDDDD